MNTVDVIKEIVGKHPDIQRIQLVSYKGAKDLASDFSQTWTADDEYFYRNALDLQQSQGLPFWHALMLSICNGVGNLIPLNCLLGSCRHHEVSSIALLDRSELDRMDEYQEFSIRTGVNSAVIMEDGRILHIPMLDFHIGVSGRNTNVVREVCDILGIKGYILSSGKSYHFIGDRLLTASEMINYLGRALLFTPIVDMVWIAHQLQDQACTLRIGYKYGVCPVVVSSI